MLDHVTRNRFEWGTGRGAGSHELASFNIMDKDSTKAEWNEVVREIPRMWEQRDYTFEGESFTVPTPHNVLPKPYGTGPPPDLGGLRQPGRRSPRPARWASGPSPSTSSRSSGSRGASTPTRRASPTAPSRSASS